MGKFDCRSDEGVFVGYSSSSKAYRVFNKRTLYIEGSFHVVFDESGDLKNIDMNMMMICWSYSNYRTKKQVGMKLR